MNDEQVARSVIRAVRQRARRMRYSIDLLLSPDDAQALLQAWWIAEESGIQFVSDGIVADGTRFRICPHMSHSRCRAPVSANQAMLSEPPQAIVQDEPKYVAELLAA